MYDRVSSFMESLYRHWEETTPGECQNEVLVAHGVTIAVFLMRFFKYSVDEFNKYENFNNCEFAVLEKDSDDGKLTLRYVIKNETLTPVKGERSVKEKYEVREMRMD